MEKRDRADSDNETAPEVPEATKGGAVDGMVDDVMEEGENGTVVAEDGGTTGDADTDGRRASIDALGTCTCRAHSRMNPV